MNSIVSCMLLISQYLETAVSRCSEKIYSRKPSPLKVNGGSNTYFISEKAVTQRCSLKTKIILGKKCVIEI